MQETRDPAFMSVLRVHTLVRVVLGVFAQVTCWLPVSAVGISVYLLAAVGGVIGPAASLAVT